MNFYVLTLFPEMIEKSLDCSIIGRAQKESIINIEYINIRDFSENKQKQVDDYPYGGGAGMVMQPQPIFSAYNSIAKENMRVIYLTPQGQVFNQKKAFELSKEKDIALICGHYEGIDERVIEEIVTDEISIGDFVLTGGEFAALSVIDAVSRLVPGVLGKQESFENESFTDGLLEYPQYTRPPVFMGKKVPEILLSGHHKNIDKWRREQAIVRTFKKRPDLLAAAELSKEDLKFLDEYKKSTF